MVAVKLLIKEHLGELALNLYGEKRKPNREELNSAMSKSGVPAQEVENLWNRTEKRIKAWPEAITRRFLTGTLKQDLIRLVQERVARLGLDFWYQVENFGLGYPWTWMPKF